ncbi:hypothetical protein BH09PAT1_BH09PAT1_7840 [soil metagenome]
MATVIHEHTTDRGNSSGTIVGIILLVVLVLLFFVYGLPMLRSYGTPQVNVPGKVDVNVNTPQK